MTPDFTFRGTERFVVEERIGAGGFGVVYRAYDLERRTTVALKTLPGNDPDSLLRFKTEFRSLSDISHPNLVALYELISTEEQWFFTMELVEGENFLQHVTSGESGESELSDENTQILSAGSRELNSQAGDWEGEVGQEPVRTAERRSVEGFDFARLRGVLGQIVSGLDFLHRSGKLHRDIKPANILVTPQERVVILDFGMAVTLIGGAASSNSLLMGTPAYMAPEQASSRSVSAASDFYSVGVLLFEAMTGSLPFLGEGIELLLRKNRVDAQPPSSLVDGIPPDLDRLCLDLLARNPADRPDGSEIIHRLAGEHPGLPGFVAGAMTAGSDVALVGREEELALLDDALSDASRGNATLVYVSGYSGMGKSLLLRRFVDDVHRRDPRAVVLSGRCYDRESVPYKALDELLDHLTEFLVHLSSGEREAVIPRDAGSLALLFPVLKQLTSIASAAGPEILDAREVRRRASNAFRELLCEIAKRRRLIVMIDDLQWGDADSAELISDVIDSPSTPPFMMVASFRREDESQSLFLPLFQRRLPAGRRTLPKDDSPGINVREIALRELPRADSQRLAEMLLGPEWPDAAQYASHIARESGGNPFFIDELVRFVRSGANVADAGKLRLDDVIRLRVSMLPADSRKLLEVVAVAGGPVRQAVTSTAVGIENRYQSVLQTLRATNMVRVRGVREEDEIETYHDRIREAVVSGLSPAQERDLHLALANTMEVSEGIDPEILGYHFSAAGDVANGARYTIVAAGNAERALAFEHAAVLYRKALALGGFDGRERELQLREKLAVALANAGHGPEAGEAYMAAAELSEGAGQIELRRSAAEQYLKSGYIVRGLEIVKSVLETFGMKLAASPKRALAALLLRRMQVRLRGLSFRRRDPLTITPYELMRIDSCWAVAVGLGLVDTIRGAEFQSRHLLLALRGGDVYRVARAAAIEAGYSAATGWGAADRTRRLLTLADELSLECGTPHAFGLTKMIHGLSATLEGRWDEGLRHCDEAEPILRERCTNVGWELFTAQMYSLICLVWGGSWGELRKRTPHLMEEVRRRGDLYGETYLRTRVTWNLLLADDAPEEAAAEGPEAIARWGQSGFHVQHYHALLVEGDSALYKGDLERAYDELLAKWDQLEKSLLLRVQIIAIEGRFLRARTSIAASAAKGDPGLLDRARRDAREMRATEAPWGKALASLVDACATVAEGDRSGAIPLFTLARTALDAGGLKLHAAAAGWRLGELMGAEGDATRAEAEAQIAAEGIRRPDRIVAMIAPV